ncbi:hypothetical protein SEA_PUPPER_229 [Gordonia phage Pupper]|uniref:Uncharacterized protein n=1 Tax=Gordonia phage Pupper TaxID=2571249 RepID=A0A4Y6EL02_9CAUD|nr:hypothetical protein KHQ83_gp048 [Gordonia phage Pupper]QDF18715.1 hypothetical protein SEA_PUPPER_229 [Gordonia phage Pupper]
MSSHYIDVRLRIESDDEITEGKHVGAWDIDDVIMQASSLSDGQLWGMAESMAQSDKWQTDGPDAIIEAIGLAGKRAVNL